MEERPAPRTLQWRDGPHRARPAPNGGTVRASRTARPKGGRSADPNTAVVDPLATVTDGTWISLAGYCSLRIGTMKIAALLLLSLSLLPAQQVKTIAGTGSPGF